MPAATVVVLVRSIVNTGRKRIDDAQTRVVDSAKNIVLGGETPWQHRRCPRRRFVPFTAAGARQSGFLPGIQTSVENRDLLVATIVQQPPRTSGPHGHVAGIEDDIAVGIDACLGERLNELRIR